MVAPTGAGSFNGAAAKSSGKYVPSRGVQPTMQTASMGPPLKAAENEKSSTDAAACRMASMGPPLKAAENQDRLGRGVRLWKLQWGRR